jgi:CheY-like chemotaxis protein
MASALKKILVVDDEPFLREIMAFDLKKAGYTTLEAENGKKAFEIICNEYLDLVISDVRMPSVGGVELLKLVRKRNVAEPPFVFVTAFSDISSEEAMDMGAESFLRKPVEKTEMLEVVKHCLTSKSERWSSDVARYEGVRSIEVSRLDLLQDWSDDLLLLGQGGAFLELQSGFPSTFEVVHFRVMLAGHPLNGLQGYGQVRWTRPQQIPGLKQGLGLEFLKLDSYSQQLVQNHLMATQPKAFIPLGAIEGQTHGK